MTIKILNFKTIISWVFKEIEKNEDVQCLYKLEWEILFNVIYKMLARSDSVKTDLRKARQKNEIESIKKLEKALDIVSNEEKTMFLLIFKVLHLLNTNKNNNIRNLIRY